VQKAQVIIDGNPPESSNAAVEAAEEKKEGEQAVAEGEQPVAEGAEAAEKDVSFLQYGADDGNEADADADAGTKADADAQADTKAAETPECSSCLEQPEGLAMWHGKEKAVLYVADSKAHRILAYEITGSMDWDPANPFGGIQVGPQQLVIKDLNAVSGLSLDGFGNLYFSTIDGQVGMLPAKQLETLSEPISAATILYTSDSQKKVSSPIAVAADDFNVYWANMANGQQEGVLIQAFERNAKELASKYPDFPKALAKNAAKAMGVCVAKNNVFFTGGTQFLYGVKTTGGGITEVYRNFQAPRGCAYDGESTLYVADSQDGSIYSLPANFPTIRPVKRVQKVVTEAVEQSQPSAVAIFTRAAAYVQQPQDKGFLGLGW